MRISGCANYGIIKGTASNSRYHGGISGCISARAEYQVTIENCLNAGNINAGIGVVGIVGWIAPVATNSIIIKIL